MKIIAPFFLTAFAVVLPMTASAAPIRTVKYHFAMDARGFGTSIGTSGYGAVSEGSTLDTDSRSGSIRVDVIAATQDGGLVVDVTESVDRALHDLQTVRCAVYGRTQTVVCDQNLVTTPEETVLLQYIGRSFYVADQVDGKGHWHADSPVTPPNEIGADYTITKTAGNVLTISVARREKVGSRLTKTDGTLVYDAAMNVPDAVKLSTTSMTGGTQADMNVDLRLLSDSMASQAPSKPR